MAVSTPPPRRPPPPTSFDPNLMAVSSSPPPRPPPPLDPLSTTIRSNFPPNPRPPHRPHQTPPFYSTTATTAYHIPLLPSNQNPNYPRLVPSTHPSASPITASSNSAVLDAAILYPVASSGRGFIARHMPLSNPSSNIYTTRPAMPSSSHPRSPFGHNHPGDPGLGQGAAYVNPTHFQQAGVAGKSAVKRPASSATFSQSQHKIAVSSPPVPSFDGHKDLRDRSKDDVLVTVCDRKVRASENASLYALCRSWLKNGSPEQLQLQNVDIVRALPRPLPLSATSPLIVEESEEDEGSVENLSEKEILQRHVKRAKRVRCRIQEQRLRRISPYKTRLSLLLQPVDSNVKNDSMAGEMK